MEILTIIKREAAKEQKLFLVIGGHALNAHGISRTTADLDLMVARNDVIFWEHNLSKNYDIHPVEGPVNCRLVDRPYVG